MKVNDFALPLCAIHGDYDFGNILFNLSTKHPVPIQQT